MCQPMSTSLLNSGGSSTRFASLYSRPASEPLQSGDEVRVEVAEWRRPTA
jgi:hypothetical protein